MKKKISFQNLNGLERSRDGLNEDELSQQRSRFGTNDIVEHAENPWGELLWETIKDPMIWFLVGIGVVFLLTGNVQDGIVLFLATLPLIFMDAFLHWRTQTSTVALKSHLASTAQVIREGHKVTVDSRDIYPGDLVVMSLENPYLPADGHWEEVNSLQVDESVLTGEALPIEKKPLGLNPFNIANETFVPAESLSYAGTKVLTGDGLFRVLFTGRQTEYGEIVNSVAQITHERTLLQKAIANLTKSLIFAAAVFCVILAIIRFYQGHGWIDALLSASTLAIAAIPEEFPVVFTFYLGVGIFRLAKHHALVRRGVSVENIGRVTQVCTDKTGTITIGQLKLTHIDPTPDKSEVEVLKYAAIASNLEGSDPIDVALFEVIKSRNIDIPVKLKVVPFTEDRKREVAFFKEGKALFCSMKGAPETILERTTLSDDNKNEWRAKVSGWAREGHKVLAVAIQKLAGMDVSKIMEPDDNFELVGLFAFEDPARPEVPIAMEYCRNNGIKVLMITGDHPDTAGAIAKEVGLTNNSPIVICAESAFEKYEESWPGLNPEFLKQADVIARCSPLQKLNIVNALKKSGEIVAVTGDGVNDVPALKAADIGIAMGMRGTRSAKEVSSIILTDDKFNTIVNAIREGRQLFSNLRLSFEYLLLFHIPFVLSAAVVPFLGYPLLYLPVHVVWLEMIIHPTALFAFQLQSKDELKSKRSNKNDFFTTAKALKILLLGVLLAIILTYFYIARLSEDNDIGHGRAQVLALLSLWSAGIVIVLTKGKSPIGIFIAVVSVISALILIQVPLLASLLHITPLHFNDWLFTSAIAILISLLV